MLPATICVGPFWTRPTIRLGGSGWITALTTPPAFGAWATAAVLSMQSMAKLINILRLDITYLVQKSWPALAGGALRWSVGKIGIGTFKHPLEGGPFAVGHATGFDRVVEAGVLAGCLAGHRRR